MMKYEWNKLRFSLCHYGKICYHNLPGQALMDMFTETWDVYKTVSQLPLKSVAFLL